MLYTLSMYIRRSLIFSAAAAAICIHISTSFICLRVSCHHPTYPRLPPTSSFFCSGQNPHCTGTTDRQNEIGGPHTHAWDQAALSLHLPTSDTIVGYLVQHPTSFLPPSCRPLHRSIGREWTANMVSPPSMGRSRTSSYTDHLPPKNPADNVCFPTFRNRNSLLRGSRFLDLPANFLFATLWHFLQNCTRPVPMLGPWKP